MWVVSVCVVVDVVGVDFSFASASAVDDGVDGDVDELGLEVVWEEGPVMWTSQRKLLNSDGENGYDEMISSMASVYV